MYIAAGEGSVTSSRDSDFITGSPMPTVATAVHTMDDSSQAVRGVSIWLSQFVKFCYSILEYNGDE